MLLNVVMDLVTVVLLVLLLIVLFKPPWFGNM
jgi:hypothetical protein